MQVYDKLTADDTNPAILNQFYTDFCKHIHSFENHAYTDESTVGKDGRTTKLKYSATLKNGNVQEVTSTVRMKWKRGIQQAIANIGSMLVNKDDKAYEAAKKELRKALVKLDVNNLESIKDAIQKANDLYGFGLITDDAEESAKYW
jgi:hypothetical protein